MCFGQHIVTEILTFVRGSHDQLTMFTVVSCLLFADNVGENVV